MPRKLLKHIVRLQPQHMTGQLGWLRGVIGAGAGIFVAGWAGYIVEPLGAGTFPVLVAPLGATAVLLFSLPASPLA